MKGFNRIKIIAWFLFFLIGIDAATNYLVVDDTGLPSRCILHNFYNRKENIDTLFLGSSHTMYGIDPEVYERITGNKAYNCGTNWQYLDSSFALLKEADRFYDLKHVYVDLYFSICRMPNRKEFTSRSLASKYAISDYMKPSWNKYSYIFSASSADHYIEGIIPQRRYIKNLTDFSYIGTVLQKKSTENYRNYIWEGQHEKVLKNGQVACELSLENKGFYYEGISNPIEDVPDSYNEWKELLVEMIHYCEQRDITITFMALPMSDFYLVQGGGAKYDEFIKEIKDIIESSGNDVNYFDFNLIKDSYLDLQESDYRDISHLNSEGAKKTTTFLANLEMDNSEQFFYNSYQEKIVGVDKIYGITLMIDEEKKLVKLIPATYADTSRVTYKITCQEKNVDTNYDEQVSFQYKTGEKYVVQTYIDKNLCNTICYTGK